MESYVLGATNGKATNLSVIVDTDTGTDTINVTQFCGAEEYTCEHSGICIGNDKICDGTVDCTDNEEDEWTWHHTRNSSL